MLHVLCSVISTCVHEKSITALYMVLVNKTFSSSDILIFNQLPYCCKEDCFLTSKSKKWEITELLVTSCYWWLVACLIISICQHSGDQKKFVHDWVKIVAAWSKNYMKWLCFFTMFWVACTELLHKVFAKFRTLFWHPHVMKVSPSDFKTAAIPRSTSYSLLKSRSTGL